MRSSRNGAPVRATALARSLLLALLAGCQDPCDPGNGAADAPPPTEATLGLAVADPCAPWADPMGGPTRVLDGGCLLGNWAEDRRVEEYLGIRYAAKMDAAHRWTPPQRVAAYAGKVDARAFGHSCPQFSFNTLIDDATDTLEDCLTLNVWAPATPVAGGAPVLVFLHGGGFYMGGSRAREIEGAALAAAVTTPDVAREGLVVVTGNYRLGVLGFLAHDRLPGAEGANFGLQDQAAILDWVHQFVGDFGGDPARVTLAGQSAGGMSVCQHLRRTYGAGATDLARFQRAVLQSGPCFENLATADQARAQGGQLAAMLGCQQPDGTPAYGVTDIVACLRGKSLDQLMHTLPMKEGLFWGDGADWTPWVDDHWVPRRAGHPLASLVAGTFQVLLGGVADEGSLVRFLIQMDDSWAQFFDVYDPAKYEAWVHRVFGGTGEDALVLDPARYPADTAWGAATRQRWEEVLGLFTFTCPIRRDARALAAGGIPSWLYRFTHGPGFEELFLGDTAYHTADLPFVFDRTPAWQVFTAAQQVLASRMSAAWARYAAIGDPDVPGSGLPAWARYDQARPLSGGDPNRQWDLAVTAQPLFDARCDFWDGLVARP